MKRGRGCRHISVRRLSGGLSGRSTRRPGNSQLMLQILKSERGMRKEASLQPSSYEARRSLGRGLTRVPGPDTTPWRGSSHGGAGPVSRPRDVGNPIYCTSRTGSRYNDRAASWLTSRATDGSLKSRGLVRGERVVEPEQQTAHSSLGSGPRAGELLTKCRSSTWPSL